MNRRRALTLLAGSGVLAGCATHASPLLHLPNGDSLRGTTGFPRRRPDGSLPPSSAAGYRPTVRLAGSPTRRQPDFVNHICFQDSCPGDGGGGENGGLQPDTVLHVGRVLGYYFNAQNYIETWSDDGSVLLDQWYWSIDVSLAQYVAQLGRVDHDVAIGGGPTKPCSSCTTTNQSVSVNVSVTGGTFSATHNNGWNISGNADGAGNVVLVANIGSDIATATVRYRPPNPSCSTLSLQASAAIAPIVLNVVATNSGCTAAPDTCTAGGVLVGAMSAGTIAAVKQWEAAQGC